MSKGVSKAASNIYCKARLEAAKYNSKFSSREGASEEIGVSKDSLTNYELDLCKTVPVDNVVRMADIYEAPHLLNHYCVNECPIGKKIIQPVDNSNIENIFKYLVVTTNTLSESPKVQQMLMTILADGKVDESEKADLAEVISFFVETEKRSSELRILAEKLLNK